jgi:site-specific DNA-cytosine methylase
MHSNNPIIPYISLCSGYEGIGLGLHRCIPNLRCVAYCEREAFAIANLVAKMESGLLDAAPVFTDVSNFPWADYAPYMAGGILSFGWPCQPVSCAGKRKATEDERWLFDIIADGISILRPGMLFAENVEGLLSARMPDGSSVFGHCIERLESLHYKVEAGIFSAAEVGSPHQRKRVFILGYSNSTPRFNVCGGERIGEELHEFGIASVTHNLANGNDKRLEGVWECCSTEGREAQTGYAGSGCNVWPSRPGEPQHGWEPPRVVAHSKLLGRRGRSDGDAGGLCGEIQTARSCGGGTEVLGNAESEQSSSRYHRGQQGLLGEQEQVQLGGGDCGALRESNGQTQPSLGGNPDGTSDRLDYAELYTTCDNRTDELRLLGNGVVPATAERAFRILLTELLTNKQP